MKLQWESTYDFTRRRLMLNGNLSLKGNQVAEKVKETVPQLQSRQWGLNCFPLHNGHLMEQPQRNAVNNLSNDIYYQDCATVCAQLSHTASSDVWSFDAASDVPPTQLHGRGQREREICRKGKEKKKREGTEMHREKTTSLPERNTLSRSVISIADASDRKCEWASCIQPESEHCSATAPQSYCTAECGSGAGIQCSAAVGIHCGYVWDSRLSSYHSQMSK